MILLDPLAELLDDWCTDINSDPFPDLTSGLPRSEGEAGRNPNHANERTAA